MNKKKTDPLGYSDSSISHGQIAYLFRHGGIWFWGNLIAASLFVLLRWVEGEQDMLLLLVWFVTISIISVLRLTFGQSFITSRQYTDDELDEFGQRFLIYSTLISSLWGVSGFILFSQNELVQALHVLLLASAVIAAMPVLAVSRFAMYLQIGIILLPITLNLLLLTDASHQSLAAATLVLAFLLIMASRSIMHLLQELQAARMQMQELANTDPVTQIANRRYFDSIFKTEWRRIAREGKNIALLMIDVDHFKRYNDRHGHHAGDQCLQIIAQCITSVARRAADVVARHGGEEFAVLLPDTSLEDATMLAERLRKKVEAQRIPHSDGAIPRIVTISIGVSCCAPTSTRDIQAISAREPVYPAMLLSAADRALYRAKRNGRNQVSSETCGQDRVRLTLPPPAKTNAA